jgi:hypothetical protein
MESFVGGTVSAITLNVRENGCTEALTDNYLKLWLRGEHSANQIVEAQVERVDGDALVGTA